MDRNSVTGRFRDIEIVFSIDSDCIIMSVRNLTDTDRRVRVMYQKLSMSGLANWAQFELTDAPVSRRLPTEILDAYRLTFFVDNAEPVYARVEKILDELNTLKAEQPAETTPEDTAELEASESEPEAQEAVDNPDPTLESAEDTTPQNAVPPLDVHTNTDEPTVSEVKARQDVEKIVVYPATTKPPNPISTLSETSSDEDASTAPELEATQQVEEPEMELPDVEIPEPVADSPDKDEPPTSEDETRQQMIASIEQMLGTNVEFKIEVPSLPPSALAEQRKAKVAQLNASNTTSSKTPSKLSLIHI